jgi:signal transduction histidine kinase
LKLLAKTSVYYFISAIIVFLLGGMIFFEVLKIIFYNQVDENLLTEKAIIEEEIQHNMNIPDYSNRFGHEIEVVLYNRFLKRAYTLKDTLIYDTIQNRDVHYRFMRVADNTAQRGYTVGILHPLRETRILMKAIVKVMFIMFMSLLLILISINYFISRRLWLPFYGTIKAIRNYDVKNKVLMIFPVTNVTEFEQLNNVLHAMSEKIRHDFFNLKEFTENASHEIQTPLAIIKSKLELLVQSENLGSTELESIQSIDQAISRLSKLNSGLLLITKIENNQFEHLEHVSLAKLIRRTLETFEEFIDHKNISIATDLDNSSEIIMNQTLAEILITNLVNNAIKHNIEGGFIKINLTQTSLSIINSGNRLDENPDELFSRFKKMSKRSDSIGLGLAIVKKICDFYQVKIVYRYYEMEHSVLLNFPVLLK